MSELLRVRGLCKTYQHGTNTLTVLKDLTFNLPAGDFVAIVGASGSGKSTLLHLLGTLDRPTSGEITLAGQDYSQLDTAQLAEVRNRKIGFVFQFHHLLPEFTALENVLIPSLITGSDRKKARQHAEFLLECLGLADRLKHKPSELSGGEQQR
ncbi:MAG TPA: ATP-binding cassette domain-containing protein, partial [bacterium]|nr:ATP-binding cassette domain-containing protein [bacterium]